MIRRLLLVLVLVVLLVGAGVGVLIWRVNDIARTAIEQGGERAMGVPTRVDGVAVALLGGTLDLDGLTVANPQGYQSPHLMRTEKFKVAVRPTAFFKDHVTIDRIELNDVHVRLERSEQNGQYNAKVIADHLEAYSQRDEPSASRRTYTVQTILLSNVRIEADLPVVGTRTVVIPKFEMHDVTSDNAKGLAIEELYGQLYPILMSSLLENAKDIGPLIEQLGPELINVARDFGVKAGKMFEGGDQAISALQQMAREQLGDDPRRTAEEVGRAAGDAVGGLLERFAGEGEDDGGGQQR